MIRRKPRLLAIAALVLSGGVAFAEPRIEVVAAGDVTLQPLNPLRGDMSPKAGVLWGDITKDEPTGTLIEFVDGFSSPLHIHNITYRAVVISGAVHNDDPDAAPMWMGPGSFWTQPAGETHITAARKGAPAIAFLEILKGPYLVQPAEEEFDNGERPINLEARNVVWLEAGEIAWMNAADALPETGGPKTAMLWGSPNEGERNGGFLKLPPGFRGELAGDGSWLRAVLIAGRADHASAGDDGDAIALDPGSYFGSTGGAAHVVSCRDDAECIFYISAEGRYQLSQS